MTGEQLASIYFSILISGILWMPASWLLLSIFTPKILLEKYFKEPHFTLAETVLMAQFPGFLMRTAMFGWTLFFPSLAERKRKIKHIEQYMPCWYAIALKCFIIGVSLTMLLILSLLGILLLIKPDQA